MLFNWLAFVSVCLINLVAISVANLCNNYEIFVPLLMKKQIETKPFLYDLFYSYFFKNPLFKLYVVPIVMLLYIAAELHTYILIAVVSMENYLRPGIQTMYAEQLILRYLLWIVSHYFITFLFECVFAIYLQATVVASFKIHIREYLKLHHDDYHELGTGKIQTLIERRTIGITDFIDLLFTTLYANLIAFYVMIKALLLHFGINLAVFNVLVLVAYALFCVYAAMQVYESRRKANMDYHGVTNRLYGILQNYDVIKAYNNDVLETERLNEKAEKVEKSWFYYDVLCSVTRCLQMLIIVVPYAVVWFMAFKGIGFVTLKTVADFSLYHKQYTVIKSNMERFGSELVRFLQSFIDTRDSHLVGKYADDNGGTVKLDRIHRGIEFRDFTLRMKDKILVEHFNLLINKGDKVAIVGKNGSGKSSLMKVLLRFYNYEGNVFIDDVDMSTISVNNQRSLISYIPQVPYLLEGTVLKNLKYSNESITNQDLKKVCVKFGTHELFSRMSNGYMTNVGESGKFLSGGQRQQVSFMRGVIKDAQIFLIDEPTANLDPVAEKVMISNIFNQLRSKTVLLIIHHFEYLRNFDRILGFYDNKITVYDRYEDFLLDSHLY